jgi:hypothetical protein
VSTTKLLSTPPASGSKVPTPCASPRAVAAAAAAGGGKASTPSTGSKLGMGSTAVPTSNRPETSAKRIGFGAATTTIATTATATDAHSTAAKAAKAAKGAAEAAATKISTTEATAAAMMASAAVAALSGSAVGAAAGAVTVEAAAAGGAAAVAGAAMPPPAHASTVTWKAVLPSLPDEDAGGHAAAAAASAFAAISAAHTTSDPIPPAGPTLVTAEGAQAAAVAAAEAAAEAMAQRLMHELRSVAESQEALARHAQVETEAVMMQVLPLYEDTNNIRVALGGVEARTAAAEACAAAVAGDVDVLRGQVNRQHQAAQEWTEQAITHQVNPIIPTRISRQSGYTVKIKSCLRAPEVIAPAHHIIVTLKCHQCEANAFFT